MSTLEIPTGTGFYTYVHLAADGSALYVGCTTHPLGRTANHVANKKISHWFTDVTAIDWVSHPTEYLMRIYESGLIVHHQTPHNKAGVKVYPPPIARTPIVPVNLPVHRDSQAIRSVQGATIRDARDAKSITATDLARIVGVTRAAVSSWERGESSPTDVRQLAIAEALGVPWSFIFGLDEVAA